MVTRVILIAVLCAMVLIFALEDSQRAEGTAFSVEQIPAPYRATCSAELEMCECLYPAFRFLEEHEELLYANALALSQKDHRPTINEMAFAWSEAESIDYWQWEEKLLNHVNMESMHDCTYEAELAQRQREGRPAGLPTFDEASRSFGER